MFEPTTIALLGALVVAWVGQLLLSTRQMRRFYARAHELRTPDTAMSIGMSGTNWKRKTYVVVVVDTDDQVVAAERLAGFTVFAELKPLPAAVGLHLDDLGKGTPPPAIDEKTWAALEQAAGFIRNKKNSSTGREME